MERGRKGSFQIERKNIRWRPKRKDGTFYHACTSDIQGALERAGAEGHDHRCSRQRTHGKKLPIRCIRRWQSCASPSKGWLILYSRNSTLTRSSWAKQKAKRFITKSEICSKACRRIDNSRTAPPSSCSPGNFGSVSFLPNHSYSFKGNVREKRRPATMVVQEAGLARGIVGDESIDALRYLALIPGRDGVPVARRRGLNPVSSMVIHALQPA